MKMKALGFIALAMMFMAGAAKAEFTVDTIGAIRSIDRCDEFGVVQPAGTIEDSLTIGDRAYFRIRLENHNSQSIWSSWQSSAGAKLRNAWYLWDNVRNLPLYNPVEANIKVGVYVSGRFTLADVIAITDEPFDPNDGGGQWFTDLICSYEVQPGDLALPVTLANSSKGEASDSGTTAYFIGQGATLMTQYSTVVLRSETHMNAISWDVITATNVCCFKFGDYWSDSMDGPLNDGARVFEKSSPGQDRTLFNAGIFVKAIDFDSNTEKDDDGNEVWRTVHERSNSTREFPPSLFIPGEVVSNYAGTVYLWTANSNSVVLADAQYTIGSNKVYKMTFDGSDASLRFRLKGVTQGTSTELFLSSTLTNVVSGSGRTITNFVSRTVACVKPLSPTVSVLANGSSSYTLNATSDYTNSIPFKVELTQAWTNDEPVVVNFKYTLTNAVSEISHTNLTKEALIALSSEWYSGYDDVLPTSVTIPSGDTESTEPDTNVRALYALGALTSSIKGDKIVITPYFTNAAMAAFFSVKPLTLTLHGMAPEIVTINTFNPEDLKSNADPSPLDVRGGVPTEFEVRVNDTYRNMQALDGTNGYFTVTWQYGGGAKVAITNDVNGNPLIPDNDGVLRVQMTYPVPSMDQNMFTTIKVTNPDGRFSEQSFYVYVKQPKNVAAAIGTAVASEGASMPVTFTLSETPLSSSLYAFLEPVNAAASNLSYAAFFTTNKVDEASRGSAGQGIPFGSGELVAVSDALLTGNGLKFYDNSSGHFVYNIRLCSTPEWNDAARVTEFTENQLVIDVTNNFPVITQVLAKQNVPGGKDKVTTATIVMSLSDPMRTFRVSMLSDVDIDKGGIESNQVVYSWEVYKQEESGYPKEPNLVFYTVGTNSVLNMEDMFGTTLTKEMCGLYRFSVRAQDKDMRGNKPQYLYFDTADSTWKYDPWRGMDTGGISPPAYPEGDPLNPGNDWSNAYVFELRIDENPYVEANPFGASGFDSDGTPIYRESDLLAGEKMGFAVAFNDKPNISGFVGVAVRATITPVDEDGVPVAFTDPALEGPGPYVPPTADRTNFTFTAANYSNTLTFVNFDGSWMGKGLVKKGQRYRLVAEVTSTSASPSTTPWNELYSPATNYFRLENSVPVVSVDPDYEGQDSETNAMMGVTYAPNEHFNFRWSVSDVRSDLEQDYTDARIAELGPTNLIVTCTVIGGYEVGSITNQSSGTFSVWFEKPGIQKLRITAKDKDGDIGYSKVVWFFVETSKNVFLYPYGPSRSAIDSDAIAQYRDQPGFGVGRVWADGGFGSIRGFVHTWTYSTSVRTASVYGEGYAAGEMDTSTSAGKSTAPKTDGDGVGTGTDRYKNESIYDSFFYRWCKNEPGKNSGGSSGSGANASTAVTAEWTALAPSPGKRGDTKLTLPSQQTEYTYPDSSALAVFSREKYVADNMGDINGDGIPDILAVRAWTSDGGESKRLYEFVGGSSESDDSGEGTVTVSDLADLASYNEDLDFLPMAATSGNPLKPSIIDWGPGGVFNALFEIRGIGESKDDRHLGLNEPGVSDYDLSEAEWYALFSDYVAATNALSGDIAADYAAATNWAKGALWTPEAWKQGSAVAGIRLNPAKSDSDGDNFDDGWEYYFWYYAKVGAVTNGVWSRLEGRRYSNAAPATGTRISPSEIVAQFDPLEAGRFGDFDNDGLSDLEEYALGTNPIDWDSDGDGISDLWEVMNGLNPLSPSDGGGNPDADYMARAEYEDDTFTVFTFANGEMFGLPTKTSPTFEADTIQSVTNLYELSVVGEGGVTNMYFTLEQVVPAGDPLALDADTEAFEAITIDDITYVKSLAPVTLTNGTEVVSAAAAPQDVTVFSSYWGATMVSKNAKIWFAEKPETIPQNDTDNLLLATEMEGFTTYTHDDSALYLGERMTFPAGTPLKSVDEAPSHMLQVYAKDFAADPLSGGLRWVSSETLETEHTNLALPLFSYGGTMYVPCVKSLDQFAVAPVDTSRSAGRHPIAKVEKERKIFLIHNQVYIHFGYDPRTAWNIASGKVSGRSWKGASGDAVRTVPYSSRDEYLLMQYRQELRDVSETGDRSKTKSMLKNGDNYLLGGAANLPGSSARFSACTTYPNLPVAFLRERNQQIFGDSTNQTISAYWQWLSQGRGAHGADTEGDGIPDGWELYVDSDPNARNGGEDEDEDKLSLVKEYAGIDSCDAYAARYDGDTLVYPEVTTITANHPGRGSFWWNKFFPTDPYDIDTDGDGLMDYAEGVKWEDSFYVGNDHYTAKFNFIYGTNEWLGVYAADGKATCFRGGGLNPCTVDTDGDLLPDAWEHQFPGVLFNNGEPDKEHFKNSVSVSPSAYEMDIAILKMADGNQLAVTNIGWQIRGGMDGTWPGDSSFDFDHDGLLNCQEYLVQTLRHLRYDDAQTPLMGVNPSTGQFLKFMPFLSWDGETFHRKCLEAGFTGLGSWKFAQLGYFTPSPHDWDPVANDKTGLENCKNYSPAGYRVLLPPDLVPIAYYRNGGRQYMCTDPRRWDSDEDGMDDYYELFHGLNPLLGSAACPEGRDEYDQLNMRFDVIARNSAGQVSSWKNYWTGWPDLRIQPAYDAIRFPWMIGTMECDADGDGLRNDEESLKVNVAQPRNTHTDPTPLWMTDSTSTKFASYTSQYYNPDPYIEEIEGYDPFIISPDIFGLPWEGFNWYAVYGLGMSGMNSTYMFSFEENEGYDTDHDFRRDAVELSGLPTNGVFKVELTSDPQIFSDPNLRQAIYFPGKVGDVGSALASHGGKFTRAVSTEPDLFKQFTLELWVKPDGAAADAVLVERVCEYGPSTLSNNTSIIRANFRMGVDGEGHAYGEYEGSTANSGRVRVTAPNALPSGAWTHLAFTFDGSEAKLFANGEVVPVAVQDGAGLIPANGVSGIRQEYHSPVIDYGYLTLPCSTIVGARAQSASAFSIDDSTTWDDFGSYFKGWIDEIRIWDGARKPSEIHADYKKRYTMDDVKKMRTNEDKTGIYDMWAAGYRRSNTTGMVLPAELLQHYSFTSLPGGVEPENVLTAPVEFQQNVMDNVRKPNGKTLDASLLAGWWSTTPVRSTVYKKYAIIPWIGNTVAHLPFLDGSSPDSQYWSENIAGVVMASSQGFVSYDYPNTANPYPYYFYRNDRFNRLKLLEAVYGGNSNATDQVDSALPAAKWQYELRKEFIGTGDLVPLGGAYAKRDVDFWDGQGAMDAWTETSKVGELADSNGNGIPTWAENLGLTTAEAYLRALAAGLLPDGTYSDAYKSVSDTNFDGVKDWWQKMYGLSGSAQKDTDKDGLADFAEYLVSEIFKFGNISPNIARSNGKEFDYFRKAGRLYLGEMFSDHDFMEDHFEREWSAIGAQHAYYDAHIDADENGWSNWADVRAKYGLGIETSLSGQMKTNLINETFTGYDIYKERLDYILSNYGECELIETDFDYAFYGYWEFVRDTYSATDERDVNASVDNRSDTVGTSGHYVWHDDYFGSGYIKYRRMTSVYSNIRTYDKYGHPVPKVVMTVRYNGSSDLTGKTLSVRSYTDGDLNQADAIFSVMNGDDRAVNTLVIQDEYKRLLPVSGYLREGKNMFVVTVGASNTTVSASTIMGVARNVDVGWNKVEFDVELLDESPICTRPTVNSSTNGSSKAYVYRYAVDGWEPPRALEYRCILERDLGNRKYLHEGDFLSDADFDIDWSRFTSEVMNSGLVDRYELPVTSVTYRVYSQPVNIEREAVITSNALDYIEFSRNFGATRAAAIPVAPGEDSTIFYNARPTFRWRMEGEMPESFTAFAIQVEDASGTPVWNSGIQLAPPRNSDGEYTWQAPLYPGDQTGLGKVFASVGSYTWKVTMYNSKYQTDEWSASSPFRVNIYAPDEASNADSYSIDVAVKYFGPGSFNTAESTVAGTLRVEAYTSPDFSGVPAGRTFVRDAASVTDAEHNVNATIVGLAPGTYYVRAYIDTDGNFKRSEWESWGYACPRGDTSGYGAIYAPTELSVGDGIETPVAEVYVEDADTDQDCLPDIWEYENAGTDKADFLLKEGPVENTHNGYISVNPYLEDAIRDLINGGSTLSLLSAGRPRMSMSLASLMLGVDSAEPSIDEKTLAIKSLSLNGDAVSLVLGAEADDPTAGTVLVSDGMVRFTAVIKYADSLGGEWKSVEKSIEKKIEDGAVSEEVTFSLSDLGLDTSKGFFKVEVK